MMAASWGLLGDLVQSSVMDVLCDGPVRSMDALVSLVHVHVQVKIAAEVLFLIHYMSAFPIVMNPPSQMFENMLNIPASRWSQVEGSIKQAMGSRGCNSCTNQPLWNKLNL